MPNIGAIVLAAGMSKRMGQPKLLLSLHGKPLFRYPLELAIRQGLNPILLIGGQHMESFQTEASDLRDVEFIRNPDYEKGMSSSLKLGIEKMKGRAEATFIFLADQPFVPDFVVQSLTQQYASGLPEGLEIVRPQYNELLGHPILIHESLFPEFLDLQGDQGGKEIIKKYSEATRVLLFDDPFWGMDIDTIEDYQVIIELLERFEA